MHSEYRRAFTVGGPGPWTMLCFDVSEMLFGTTQAVFFSVEE